MRWIASGVLAQLIRIKILVNSNMHIFVSFGILCIDVIPFKNKLSVTFVFKRVLISIFQQGLQSLTVIKNTNTNKDCNWKVIVIMLIQVLLDLELARAFIIWIPHFDSEVRLSKSRFA